MKPRKFSWSQVRKAIGLVVVRVSRRRYLRQTLCASFFSRSSRTFLNCPRLPIVLFHTQLKLLPASLRVPEESLNLLQPFQSPYQLTRLRLLLILLV